VTWNLAETSVAKSRPSVLYGANFFHSWESSVEAAAQLQETFSGWAMYEVSGSFCLVGVL